MNVSKPLPFDEPVYYHDEMGEKLRGRFIAMAELIALDKLVEAKLRANAIEMRFLRPRSGMRVNLDSVSHALTNSAKSAGFAEAER